MKPFVAVDDVCIFLSRVGWVFFFCSLVAEKPD